METSTDREPPDPLARPVLPDPLCLVPQVRKAVQESLDRKALQDQRDRLEQWVRQAQQVQPGPSELLVPLGQRVLRVQPVPQELPAQPVPQDRQD